MPGKAAPPPPPPLGPPPVELLAKAKAKAAVASPAPPMPPPSELGAQEKEQYLELVALGEVDGGRRWPAQSGGPVVGGSIIFCPLFFFVSRRGFDIFLGTT
jgi:hypothetical protein